MHCSQFWLWVVCRYEPPSTGLVLRDTDEGLIRKPERFQELAHISKQRHLDCVYFWIPIPPPGYSAMGCIAGKSPRPDKDVMESIRCVRNDLVSSSNFSVSSLWTTRYLEPRQQHLSIWPVENEVNVLEVIFLYEVVWRKTLYRSRWFNVFVFILQWVPDSNVLNLPVNSLFPLNVKLVSWRLQGSRCACGAVTNFFR